MGTGHTSVSHTRALVAVGWATASWETLPNIVHLPLVRAVSTLLSAEPYDSRHWFSSLDMYTPAIPGGGVALHWGETAVTVTLRYVRSYQRRVSGDLVQQKLAHLGPRCVGRGVVVGNGDCSGAGVSTTVGATLF